MYFCSPTEIQKLTLSADIRWVQVVVENNLKIMKSKKNFIAKDLFTKKYKPRVIKPKKGKGSFKRKKK